MLRKAEALRTAFRVPEDVPLPVAIEGMSKSMGLPYKLDHHPLPEQIEKLCEVMGIAVEGTAASSIADAPPAAAPPAAAPSALYLDGVSIAPAR